VQRPAVAHALDELGAIAGRRPAEEDAFPDRESAAQPGGLANCSRDGHGGTIPAAALNRTASMLPTGRRYDGCMSAARAHEGRLSRSAGGLRRTVLAVALWLLAAFVVGGLADTLLSPVLLRAERVSFGILHASFWENGGNVRVSFTEEWDDDDPPSGGIGFVPEHTYYRPSGVSFRTRFFTSRSTNAYYFDDRPDAVVPQERIDQWRPAIADAMMSAGYPSELVEEVRKPDYHRRGWNLWFVFLNGLILVAPIWVLHQLWRAAGLGPLPFTRRQRRLAKLRRGRCPDCGYDIRGLPQRRCPECGATWSADDAQAESTAP
jgi:hypothetical protein